MLDGDARCWIPWLGARGQQVPDRGLREMGHYQRLPNVTKDYLFWVLFGSDDKV